MSDKSEKKFSAPYDGIDPDGLTMRDMLAMQRTNLANERTFLAYIRSSIGFLVVGISFIEFLDSVAIEVVGGLFVVASLLVFLVGWYQYRKRRSQIPHVRNARSGK